MQRPSCVFKYLAIFNRKRITKATDYKHGSYGPAERGVGRSRGKNYSISPEFPIHLARMGSQRHVALVVPDSKPPHVRPSPDQLISSPRLRVNWSYLAPLGSRFRRVSPVVTPPVAPPCLPLLALVFSLLAFAAPVFASGADNPPTNPAAPSTLRPADPLGQSAVEHYYNLDHDTAIQDFEKIVARHPSDPFAMNHLLSALLVRELYRMGAINTGEYTNDSFIGLAHRPADPAQKERIKQLVREAEKIEEAELSRDPNNVDMLYARGVTRAQFALYTALIERAWFSALRNAVGARHDHERVLELDPHYTDAKLVVGTHNYVMGSLSFAVKVAVALVGLSGDKAKGIQYLYDDYRANGETSVDAGMVLLVFLRREHRYAEALEIATAVAPRFPRNYLLPLEQGNLLRASGKLDQAEEQYRRVWQNGRDGKYGNLHYEMAALALADLLRSEKKYSAAAAAYEQVGQVTAADPELLQKANLGAGEMYDLLQNRTLALAKYQAVVAVNSEGPEADRARKRMKDAYRE
jgi:tetratricopeptide (TPR) repeat protein